MEEGPKVQNILSVESKGTCFFCLQCDRTDRRKGSLHSPQDDDHLSFGVVSRYLKLDLHKVFQAPPLTLQSASLLESSELAVKFCQKCAQEVRKFCSLQKQLDSILMRMRVSLQRMHLIMVTAENDKVSVNQYQQRMIKSSNPVDIMTLGIFDNLRKEMMEKSSNRLKRGCTSHEEEDDEFRGEPKNKRARLSRSEESETVASPNNVEEEEGDDGLSAITIVSVTGGNSGQDAAGDGKKKKSHVKSTSSSAICSPEKIGVVTSPPSPPPAPPPEATDIGYTTLVKGGKYGKFQCLKCDKIITGQRNKAKHTAFHLAAQRNQCPCPYCPTELPYAGNLRRHQLMKHRGSFFLSYKDPKLSEKKFDDLVNEIFERYEYKKLPNSMFTCEFCNDRTYNQKCDILGHMMTVHLDKLVPQVMNKQVSYFMNMNETEELEETHAASDAVDVENEVGTNDSLANNEVPHFEEEVMIQTHDSNGSTEIIDLEKEEMTPVSSNSSQIGNGSNNLQGGLIMLPKTLGNAVLLVASSLPLSTGSQNSQYVQLELERLPLNRLATTTSLPSGSNGKNSTADVVNHKPDTDETRKRVKCAHCSQIFADHGALRSHVLQHHRDKLFAQYRNPKWSVQQFLEKISKLLKQYIQYFPNEERFFKHRCSQCSKCYRHLSEAEAHVIQVHTGEFTTALEKAKGAIVSKSKGEDVITIDDDGEDSSDDNTLIIGV